jgi:rhamnosyltransferase
MMKNTSAVVVTYHPQLEQLGRLIDSLTRQCFYVIVVDNSESNFQDTKDYFQAYPFVSVITLKYNSGIAKAQNIGIKLSMDKNADAICLFDQDSEIKDDFVEGLWSAHFAITAKKTTRVAAIGPNYTNANNQVASPFVNIKYLSIRRVVCEVNAEFVPVDCLISSGCMLFVDALRTIGLMQEHLFIDYVDTEWCLRAKQSGLFCFGACQVPMHHSIGDGTVKFLGRRFSMHAPARHYYLMRNATYLYLRSNLPFQWKIADGLRLLCKFLIYIVVGKPRLNHFSMMTRGIWHGLIGRMGKL